MRAGREGGRSLTPGCMMGCCSEGKKSKPEPAEEEEEGDFPRVAGWKEIAALGLLTSTTGCTGGSVRLIGGLAGILGGCSGLGGVGGVGLW